VTPHKALQEATSSSCDVFLRPPGSAPLQCCCCLDTIDIQPAGACSSCSEEDVSALPLCAKCLQRHSQPEAFKRLRGHRFQALRAPALEPLAALGLDTAAAGLCMLHRAEPVRYFCREPHCNVGLCGQCVPAHSGHAFADLTASHGPLRAALLAHVYESSCWPAAAGGAAATVAAAASAPAPRDHPVAEDELLDRLDFNSAARRSLTEELAAASQATAEAFDAAAAALASALEVRGMGEGMGGLLLSVPHAPSLRHARRPARRPSSPTLQWRGPPKWLPWRGRRRRWCRRGTACATWLLAYAVQSTRSLPLSWHRSIRNSARGLRRPSAWRGLCHRGDSSALAWPWIPGDSPSSLPWRLPLAPCQSTSPDSLLTLRYGSASLCLSA